MNLIKFSEEYPNGLSCKSKIKEIRDTTARRWIPANFHDIKEEYLQLYLNGFCYRFNRRYFGEALFDRLIIGGCQTQK